MIMSLSSIMRYVQHVLLLYSISAILCDHALGGHPSPEPRPATSMEQNNQSRRIWYSESEYTSHNITGANETQPTEFEYDYAEAEAEPGTMSIPVPRLDASYAPSLQWHVGIYTKTFTPYMQICGGTLVKKDVVLSAAHCFWEDGVGALRPALFGVAAGKLLRPWVTLVEDSAQYSDVKDIKIPPRFHGGSTSFQDDIAIVLLTDPFEFGPGVMPVCVDFDLPLDRSQLQSGTMGTIAGWGLTEPNGSPSQTLNFLELPYVDVEQCIRTAQPSFLRYITSDKICAGDQKSGRALCRGDSGGGLIFKTGDVPYLRGIASTAPRDNNDCNAHAVASFTHARAHMTFILDHVPDIKEGCKLYEKTSEKEMASDLSSLRQAEQGDDGQMKTVTMNAEIQAEQGDDGQMKTVTMNAERQAEQGDDGQMKTVTMNAERHAEQGDDGQMKTVTMNAERHAEQGDDGQMETVTMNLGSGARVMVTPMDHNANTFVFNCLCKECGTK